MNIYCLNKSNNSNLNKTLLNINKDFIFDFDEHYHDNLNSMIVEEKDMKHIETLTFYQMKNFVYCYLTNKSNKNDLYLIFDVNQYQKELEIFIKKYFNEINIINK